MPPPRPAARAGDCRPARISAAGGGSSAIAPCFSRSLRKLSTLFANHHHRTLYGARKRHRACQLIAQPPHHWRVRGLDPRDLLGAEFVAPSAGLAAAEE